MTLKQKILKLFYPALMKVQKTETKKMILLNEKATNPVQSFYSLAGTLINNQPFDFTALQGKKVLIVNVASNCGFTGQYAELEQLHQQYKSKLTILGFPANDFKGQEPGSNQDIASFCQVNYGVTFPLFQKQSVVKGAQQEVYKWLTDPSANGWNAQEPTWNFCKYLVDEKGKLIGFFPATMSPLSKDLVSLL